MTDTPVTPVFVDRQTAAAWLMISPDTFDTWVRSGFAPQAHINRGQIIRWHWPSLEALFSTRAAQVAHDPSIVKPTTDPVELARIARHVERKAAKSLLRSKIDVPNFETPPTPRLPDEPSEP
jgi:hypothetical protein